MPETRVTCWGGICPRIWRELPARTVCLLETLRLVVAAEHEKAPLPGRILQWNRPTQGASDFAPFSPAYRPSLSQLDAMALLTDDRLALMTAAAFTRVMPSP